jgi:predicted dehydrogenase
MGISIGLVGLGSFGAAFAGLFKAHPLVDRIAFCDREPERVAKFATDPAFQDKFKASDAYDSLEAICRADLDAIVLITQPWLHAAQAIQVMQAGKDVYSAVPVVMLPDGDEILDWCDKLVETSRRTGKHYMLGETTYYRPQAMYCRRQAAEGAFGHFVYAEGEYFHDVDHGLREVQRRRLASQAGQEWRALAKTYQARGVVSGPMHYPTHSTAGPMCVMNAHAVKVCAWGYLDPDRDPYFEDAFSNETALFTMSNGATMRICEYRQVGHPESEIFRIFGTQGSFKENSWLTKHDAKPLTIADMRDPLPDHVAEAFRNISQTSDFYGGHGGSHAYLVHEFVEAVAHQRTPAINVWEAVRYMAAGVMAHKSALRQGEIMDVPDWGDAPH